MIVTPKLQMGMSFEDNLLDVGKGGLSWSAFVGTVAYGAGQFGRGWSIPTSGTLAKISAGPANNPCDISIDYTICFTINKVSTTQGSRLFSGGAADHAGTFNGILVQIQNTGAIKLDVANNVTTTTMGIGKWTVVIRRTSTAYYIWFYNNGTGVLTKETFSGTFGAITWSNRKWRLNNIVYVSNDITLTSDLYGLDMLDHFQLFNKSLSDADCHRLIQGFHPLYA